MNKIYICRGVSGSGKSSQAWLLSEEIFSKGEPYPERLEADMWFIRENGEYRFDPMELTNAHNWCRLSTEHAIRRGSSVIVSNTFTRRSELKPYIELALRYNVHLQIIETSTEWCRDAFECARRNVHGLSVETIQKQLARWEHVIPKVYGGKALEKLLRECSK